MNKLITATELDKNQKTIMNVVEERVIAFNKKRIVKELKNQRDLKRIELNDEEYVLNNAEREAIKISIVNDEETLIFRNNESILLESQKENYSEIRSTIDSLNEMDKYAVDIERAEIQTVENFRTFEHVVNHSIFHNQLCMSILKNKRIDINNKLEQLKVSNPETFDFNALLENSFELMMKMRQMYNVSTDVDDFELFDKYNLETNIDYANKISEMLWLKIANGSLSENILNEFLPKKYNNTELNKHVKSQVVSNKMLAILFSKEFISNNSVTTLKTTYTKNMNLEKVYRTRTLGEILLEITNEENKLKSKEERQQIYITYDGMRPSKEEYYKWNGMQVFDIDLKYWIQRSGGNIELLKHELHKHLSEFHWYLWIAISSSGNGLHIYTKVTPPHHVYTKAEDNEYISKYWYTINYITKLHNLYDILHRLHKIKENHIDFTDFFKQRKDVVTHEFNDVEENKYVDNVVSRITAGIRLACDSAPLVNANFIDAHVGLALGQTLDGYEYHQTIQSVIFRPSKFIDNLNNNLVVESKEDYLAKQNTSGIDLSKFITLNIDIGEIKTIPKNNINYVTRYNVCNTLASLFGKDGLSIAHKVLDSQGCNNIEEINSFYSCAISNVKEPSKLGLEILKKTGIIKHVEPELIEITETGYKNDLKHQIESSLINAEQNIDYELLHGQYLTDIKSDLLEIITGEKINIVLSPPGSGKTQFILNLAKEGKRVLLVLPYISVIKNKVETDMQITELFDTFYGTTDIKDIAYGRNAVTTFDKFSRSNYEKISKMFDYIFIDESHLLFTSSYRIEATSNVIKKIKELFYISSNDPFASKIVLMTGTETGESYFFDKVSRITRISKPQMEKKMEFLICGDTLDSITRLASKGATLISNGYRLMIPTNKGEIYSEKIIGMIEYLLQRPIKYGYYKRSNIEQELCRLINEDNTIGDYEIVFCSNYLSVGVDINDKLDGDNIEMKFASIYLGNFSGYEIEQFNARIRKTGITSIYCMTTNKSDGSTNDLLLNEPDLLLKITDEDQLFFIDDKSIAGAKTEFIASYDPVLHRITTPGFSLLNGKIQFNLEEYELVSFENKYSVCMEHPIKVSRELAKYGYQITVSTEFEGLSQSEQETLKKMGIEAAKNEKVRKHNLLVGTFVDLINQNTFANDYGLEYNDAIEWVMKNSDKIVEDRELTREQTLNGVTEIIPCYAHIIFDIFATPQQIIVRSREALEKMIKPAKYLISRYSKHKALDIIYQYVDDNGILKQKNFQRAINLLKIIDSSDSNELAEPITKSLEKMYLFVDKFEINKDYRIGYETYQAILDTWTNEYIDYLGIKINTKYGFDKIRDGLVEMLNDLSTKQSGKNGIRFSYNKLPEQDSTNILNRRSIDTLITSMFNITENIITNKRRLKDKHIVLKEVSF